MSLVATILVSCGTTSTVPITGRKQTLLVSDGEVLSLSTQQYQQYMQQERSNYGTEKKASRRFKLDLTTTPKHRVIGSVMRTTMTEENRKSIGPLIQEPIQENH